MTTCYEVFLAPDGSVQSSNMSREVLDPDPAINAVLLQLRGQLRVALKPGNHGTISVRDCSVQDGHLRYWESGWRPRIEVSGLTIAAQ